MSLGKANGADTRSEAFAVLSVQSNDKEPMVPLELEDIPRYYHGFQLFIVMLALLLSMFLVWLSCTSVLS